MPRRSPKRSERRGASKGRAIPQWSNYDRFASGRISVGALREGQYTKAESVWEVVRMTSEDKPVMLAFEQAESPADSWAGRVALVVDDSMLIRHTVCRHLEERGFRVDTATNGAEALAMIPGLRPDVIITDLLMPEMGGRELITRIRGNPELASTPVIVVAAKIKANYEPEETRADFIVYKDIE